MKPDRALPWYVFAVFVVLTLLSTSYVWQTTQAADRARFDNAVQATRDDIGARLDTYINVLTATRGRCASTPIRWSSSRPCAPRSRPSARPRRRKG